MLIVSGLIVVLIASIEEALQVVIEVLIVPCVISNRISSRFSDRRHGILREAWFLISNRAGDTDSRNLIQLVGDVGMLCEGRQIDITLYLGRYRINHFS